jgi:hypothetical protein
MVPLPRSRLASILKPGLHSIRVDQKRPRRIAPTTTVSTGVPMGVRPASCPALAPIQVRRKLCESGAVVTRSVRGGEERIDEVLEEHAGETGSSGKSA